MQKQPATEPMTVTVTEAKRLSGLGRTKLYELIGDGTLKAVSVGRRRLIDFRSLKTLTGQSVAA